jgi:hypothetical protein
MEPSRQRIHVFRSWDECPPRLTREIVLVEVPGKWVHSVVSLIRASEEHPHAGLLVTNIGPGSQAARAGMMQGDVLLRYEGQELDNVVTLRRLTKAYTQGAAARKQIRIEAARGSHDVAFEVRGGHLGITISPLLHRAATSSSRWKRILRRDRKEMVTPRVVHTLEEAREHSPSDPALVLVPGKLARPVLAVLRALESDGSRKRKMRAKSLLTAARRLG